MKTLFNIIVFFFFGNLFAQSNFNDIVVEKKSNQPLVMQVFSLKKFIP